jgi:hypothetical protein
VLPDRLNVLDERLRSVILQAATHTRIISWGSSTGEGDSRRGGALPTSTLVEEGDVILRRVETARVRATRSSTWSSVEEYDGHTLGVAVLGDGEVVDGRDGKARGEVGLDDGVHGASRRG